MKLLHTPAKCLHNASDLIILNNLQIASTNFTNAFI